MKTEGFESSRIINAVAGEVHSRKSDLKWKRLAEYKDFDGEPTNLFYLKSGKPMPVGGDRDSNFLEYGFIRNPVEHRGMSKPFPERKSQSLLLQLRGLMGVNSRSEILLYLILNQKGTIQEIATPELLFMAFLFRMFSLKWGIRLLFIFRKQNVDVYIIWIRSHG